MRLSCCRLNLTSIDAALPVLAFAFCAVLACRHLDDLVLVPVCSLVLAAGGADHLDVARARDRVFLAGTSTETGGAFFFFFIFFFSFFFFFFFFLLTTGHTTGGLLLGCLLGLDETLGTDWVWFVIKRVTRI